MAMFQYIPRNVQSRTVLMTGSFVFRPLFILACLVLSRSPLFGQMRPNTEMVARAAINSYMVTLLPEIHEDDYSPSLERLNLGIQEVVVFAVTPYRATDVTPLLLAVFRDEIFQLGGFAGNELRSFVSMYNKVVGLDSAGIVAFSEMLALLADPNGAQAIIYTSTGRSIPAIDTSGSVVNWFVKSGNQIIDDEALERPSGTRMVRVSVLSLRVGMVSQWCAYVYGFEYDHSFDLITWSVRNAGCQAIPLGEDGQRRSH
jgi:hypothetical protein